MTLIPVYKPWITDLEKKYINDVLDSGWISSGHYVKKAEALFSAFVGTKHAVATTSGTTALHLSIKALELDEPGHIAIPDTTFIATAFASSYENERPVLISVSQETWNIDLDHLETLCKTFKFNVVIPVHLYGNPSDMIRLQELSKKYGFKIIEDACEALGASINNQSVGTFGDLACFSFYANKTLTCAEGGMVVTNDDNYAERSRFLRGQAQDPDKRYWHTDIGHNYRMTDLQAAVLCGQLERVEQILEEKERVAQRYLTNLANVEEIKVQKVMDGHSHSNWLVTILMSSTKNDIMMAWLLSNNIDSRKVFYPVSVMPPYKSAIHGSTTVAHHLSEYGISLPSYPELEDSEIDYICDVLKQKLIGQKPA